MAVTFKLVEADTSNEIDLVYDAATQAQYQTYINGRSLDGPISAKFHTPDDAPPELIQLVPGIRTMFFRLNIEGADADDTLNKITDLARWIDGEGQQAARYWIDGDVNRIELHVAIDGATNVTKIPIVYGALSAIDAMLNVFGEDNAMAYGASVQLYAAPYGEGDSFTLRNDLGSSSHMLEDSNSDGLADGWVSLASATHSISTGSYVIGGKGQVTNGTSIGQGIQSPNVAISGGGTAVMYVWINMQTATQLNVIFNDSVANITSVTFTQAQVAGIADATHIDPNGNTWYRIVLSGTANGSATYVYMRVNLNQAGTQRFDIDAAYIQTGTTTPPPGMAWCSSKTLYNRYDPSASNPNYINYLDVWGIPGDAQALTVVELAATLSLVAGQTRSVIVAKNTDGTQLAASRVHRYEAESMSSPDNPGVTFWTETASGSSSGGKYDRIQASAATALGWIYQNLTGDNADIFVSKNRRVFALARSSNAGTTLELYDATYGVGDIDTKPVSFSAANTWELLDLGLINHEGAGTINYQQGTGFSVLITLPISGNTCDIDCFFVMPMDRENGLIIINSGATGTFYIDGQYKAVERSGEARFSYQGGLWTIESGQKMSRYIVVYGHAVNGTTTAYDLTDPTTVTLTVIPRTRHLLGDS